jgi:hypothetical protein
MLLRSTLASVLLLAGCVDEPYYTSGYPQSYDYYYYPGDDVYYHPYSGWYYYQDHGRWLRAHQLPPSRHLDWHQRRLLIIREPEPWRRHEEHRRDYAPQKPAAPVPPSVAPRPKPPSAAEHERRTRPSEPRGERRPEPERRQSDFRAPDRDMRRDDRAPRMEPRRDSAPARREAGPSRDRGRDEGGRDRGGRDRDRGRDDD